MLEGSMLDEKVEEVGKNGGAEKLKKAANKIDTFDLW